MPTPEPLPISPLLSVVAGVLPPEQPLYLVGGAVRDALMGRVGHDLDFALPGDALRVARRVADKIGAAFFPLDDERGTARLVLIHDDGARDVLDFAAFRGPDLEADLRSRDFTLNALALDVHAQTLFDPLGGAADLRAKRLRACSPTAFTDDPVRILRAVRMAAALDLHIVPETRRAMKDAAPDLPRVSPERQRDELFRILEGPRPAASLRALDMLGVLPAFLPELPSLKGVGQPKPHVNDVWEHTLGVLGHLESILAALSPKYDPDTAADLVNGLLALRLGRYREKIAEHFAVSLNADRSLRGLLFLAALYHDVAKPLARTTDENGRPRFWGHDVEGAEAAARRARRLHLSNDETDRLRRIIRNHMRVHFHISRMDGEGKPPSRRAVYRFFRDTREAGVDVILLALADLRAAYEHTLPQDTWAAALDVSRVLLENWWEKPAETIAPPQLLNGRDVMGAFDLAPGPLVGRLLEAIREAQATGTVSEREEALVFGREWLDEQAVKRGG